MDDKVGRTARYKFRQEERPVFVFQEDEDLVEGFPVLDEDVGPSVVKNPVEVKFQAPDLAGDPQIVARPGGPYAELRMQPFYRSQQCPQPSRMHSLTDCC